MAERIVSPGVFTTEIDASFLPTAISDLGAALIGTCNKGPAFTPTKVDSYSDFKITFGDADVEHFLPYTAKSYLKNAGTATIVRVLGTAGYTATKPLILKTAAGNTTPYAGHASGSFTFDSTPANTFSDGGKMYVTGSGGVEYTFISLTTEPPDVPAANTYYITYAGNSNANVLSTLSDLATEINAASIGLIASASGDVYKLHLTASSAGTGGNGMGFYSGSVATGETAALKFGTTANSAGKNLTGGNLLAMVFPQKNVGGDEYNSGFASATIDANSNTVESLQIAWDGSSNLSPTMSLKSSDDNYIVDVLGDQPDVNYNTVDSTKAGYVHTIMKNFTDNVADSTQIYKLSDVDNTFGVGSGGYNNAKTPFITGPQASGTVVDLFKFAHLSDGDASNQDIKVGILNIKHHSAVAGSDYGTFDVVVRKYTDDDTDKRPIVLETFTNCNLDSKSPNYVAKRIGDMRKYYSNNKVVWDGDYDNASKYIRIDSMNNQIKSGKIGKNLVPFGFRSYTYPMKASAGNIIDIPLQLNQTGSDGVYNSKIYHGVAFDTGSGGKDDISSYLAAYPDSNSLTSSAFSLDQAGLSLNPSSSALATKKFIVGFQGGTDGWDPRFSGGPSVSAEPGLKYGLGKGDPKNVTADKTAWKNAINTIANPDEVDINMVVCPGINKKNHGEVYTHARDVVEDRGDSFLVFDAGDYDSTISDVVGANGVQGEDTNYAATYYPWVKILDDTNSSQVWVPPSVVVPGILAFTDKVAHPWFAPAGLNRGGISEAIMAQTRLTHDERDTLYEGRVNPIASFPGQGVCVWGQKTLQAKPSALDRINVRRLLIALKKFIASTSRFLVFEQNTSVLRNRFLNIVNPYLETVQSNSGLTAFKVVMDDTNNSPDVIDRNELQGQIFIQPTRTAEFIVLDFVVMPTGASFPE